MPIIVDSKKFKKGHVCPAVAVCPAGAIIQKDKDTEPTIDHSKCIACQLCVSICDNGEIKWED